MSITSIINRNNYTGNDSTAVYSYTFKVYTKNDFEIKVRNTSTGVETLLVVDVNYTVSNAGAVSGGNITLIGAGAWIVASKLTTGYELSIRRLREIKQLADIKNQGSFFPETHEDVFDKLTMVDLQQQDALDRSIKLPSSVNPTAFNTNIPASLVGSANKSFITNATGDGFDVGPTASEIASAQGYAIAADASAQASQASAVASAVSETASAASAVQSAASASAAAATLASALWRDIVFLTSAASPYSVTSADNGKLFVCDTSSAAIVINLIEISTVTLPFNIGVKLEAGANTVTINRAGSDTIAGATSKVLNAVSTGTQLIAEDSTSPDIWTALEFGLVPSNYTVDTFNGTGSQTDFTLSVDPGSVNNTYIFVSGVYQAKATYSLTGTTLTFTEAPPAGTGNIQVGSGGTLPIGTPSDATVTLAKLASNALESLVPSGSILPFGGTTAPVGFLICQGLAVSRTTYANLFATIGTSFGSGNGTTTFNVPNLRGVVLRGWDAGAGVDPDAAGRVALATGGNTGDNIGSYQSDALRTHTHTYNARTVVGNTVGGVAGSNGVDDSTNLIASGPPVGGTISSSETRMKNVNVNYIIKY